MASTRDVQKEKEGCSRCSVVVIGMGLGDWVWRA